MPTKAQQAEREHAADQLREWLKPGDTVFCILRHRSTSGMFRVIQLMTMLNDDAQDRRWIGYRAAEAMDDKYDQQREGIRVSGAGMDMGFHLVYNLGRTLWPNGYDCVGERCRSNDHTNGAPRDSRAHHTDGGYALRCEWL